jgi:hypothetical protein
MMNTALQTTAYATRVTGALIFNRDMVLDIPVITNLELLLRQQRQIAIDTNFIRANR